MSSSIVIAIPHAGLRVPEAVELRLAPWIDDGFLLAQSDAYSDRLYEGLGVPTLRFEWSRLLVDPNRSPEGLDAAPLKDFSGRDLYPVPLNRAVRRKLIDELHGPYHEAVAEALHGRKLWIDGHAMASVGPALSPDPGEARALAIIGTRGDERGEGELVTCPPELARAATEALADRLFEAPAPAAPGLVEPSSMLEPVRLNHHFRGGHGIQRHRGAVPGIQLELNQGLWCCPKTFRLDHARMAWLQLRLRGWLDDLERIVDGS